MKIYRVTFANNQVISCREEPENMGINGKYEYQHNNGKLIYALVEAQNEKTAGEAANIIIKEFTEKNTQHG